MPDLIPKNGNSNALHVITPLVPSASLTEVCGHEVLLKLENTQPAGSFKIRGIGHFLQKSVEKGCSHVVSSSGGNAGMASAYAANKLKVPATVIIPETTPKIMISLLEEEKANVVVHGRVWNEAHKKATELAQREGSCLVHPFDDADIWDGHSTMITELLEQTPVKPSAIVVSVGGGGLLSGVFVGLHKHGVADIPVVTMETHGANSYNAALSAGKPVNIGEITSIAKTLGALCVTDGVFTQRKGVKVSSHMVSDRESVEACIRFADEHRMLVEPSCGATLAAGYTGLIKNLVSEKFITKEGPIVFVVCGGSAATLPMMEEWKKMANL